ncbi:MAG: bifunctional 4-hydroxy-3-methylbut-2-enyl diphosphate reductase/30S ribosomal protein S1, partial [Armatimonadetes bacterium]|nr:bifunctional 4-hydroxy-3-methylbut-2-enyl diphosphate reductase/30S ribosomal protein S1 [Armatimonadota bacterium]
TQPRDSLEALLVALLPEVEELIVANTICEATTTRQQASVAKALQVDLMIVVGGYHSANTRRLAQICQATGAATHHIETAAEIDPQWLDGAATVGVTAGASTPLEAVQAVAARLRKLAENEQEE